MHHSSADLPVNLATEQSIKLVDCRSLSELSLHCPGLKTFDFINYLECSKVRVRRVIEFLRSVTHTIPNRKVLDFGAWLGNFSLAVSFEGWETSACEMWARYSPILDAQKKFLADDYHRIDVFDSIMITQRPQGPRYGAVLLMGVIEHISDTPKTLLKSLYNAIVPGGFLIVDMPNLAYLFNRMKLNRGLSPYTPVQEQFHTAIPFEGHVREYTCSELHWMLKETGFDIVHTEFFNYSWNIPFWKSPLANSRMLLDETKREIVFMVGRK